MKRLLIALTAVLALAAASCSTSAGATPAATVNGSDITTETLMSEVGGYASNDQFVEQYTAQEGAKVFGATEGSYDATFTARVLSLLVVGELTNQELATRSLTVSDEDLTAAQAQFEQQFGAEATSMPADFQTRRVAAIAASAVLATALEAETSAPAEITDADLRAAYDQSIDTFMQRSGGSVACVSHILVSWDPNAAADAAPVAPTPDQEAAALTKANDLEAQLAAGADFGTLATTESKDPGSAAEKGNLGCKPAGAGYVPEFEAAIWAQPVGEPGPPVKSEFGYHIILVRSRGIVPFEEVKEEIRQGLEAQRADSSNAVGTWLQQAAKDAEVSVNPMYGTWDPEQLIVPPEGASTQTTVAAGPGSDSTVPSNGLVTEGG